FFSSRRRHTRFSRDWSSDVCSSDLKIDPWSPVEGRLLNKIDIQHNRKVCVIGERVRETMFDKEEPAIGKYLKVNGVYFQVVGVRSEERRVGKEGGSRWSSCR